MSIKKSINLVEIIIDEIALEGLDGITLEALWQRLSVRLEEPLPLKKPFMEQIWNICIEIHDLTFHELEKPRENLIIFDRYELEYLNTELANENEQKDIYLHCPVDDTKAGIKGSCATYFTRKNITDKVKCLSLLEATKYGQKLVIVASQAQREQALIDESINPILQLQLTHYCLLERIGRARYIGEITIKKSSSIKEDAKTLFYIRKGLQDNGLIRKQVYVQGNSGGNYNGQNTGTLVHLPRFFNTRKPKVIMWAEHLINYLKSKEKYAAEYYEVKNELNIDYSIKKFFKIQILQKIFRTDIKVPYRTYYPNSLDKEWQVKANPTKERIIRLVALTDPNIEINDLWRTEEVREDDDHYQMDIRNQKLNIPFLKQIYKAVESKESKGASQTQLASELGYTKLISRTLVRNLVKGDIVSTYLDDVGRQRTTKFVSRKYDKSLLKKQFDEEISKIKEYSRSVQIEKVEEKLSDGTDEKQNQQSKNETEIAEPIIDKLDNDNDNDAKYHLLIKVNNILRKYKLFKNRRRYQYTSSKRLNKLSILKMMKTKKNIKENATKDNLTRDVVSENETEKIVDTDFYKTIETKLIVQKPECKKKSKNIAVVGLMENVHNSSNNKQLNVSYRLLRRANLIIESVKEHKIIEDTHKLMKYINAEEGKEGLEAKIDRHSLIRLLQKLAEDNFIKNIKLVLKNKKLTNQKIINFICDPSVDKNDTVIQSAVEQAKLKFCMSASNSQKFIDLISTENTTSNSSNVHRNDRDIIINRDNKLGKKHGYCPKFVRIKTMHIYLYYLVFDHPGKQISKDEFLENLKKEGFSIDGLIEYDIKAYSKEINWKMFVPPLSKHKDFGQGWTLMCDVLMRIPLSLFLKVNNVNYEVPGLEEYLNHPIKRHFLVKDLPMPIRNRLYLKRKYMFSIHEIVTRLCFLGLVQLGPQMLKDKDQVFVFLNRHTELLDTTSSAAGYHKIEDKPYPVTKFTFTSLAVVENYWYEMWNTCINTCLGGRSVVEGKDILLEDLSRKPDMIKALKPRAAEEAEKYDTGYVPGDRKGAAGIDSAFFPHLKRNWDWLSSNQRIPIKKDQLETLKLSKIGNKTAGVQARKALQAKRKSVPTKQNLDKASGNTKTVSGLSTKPPAKAKREKVPTLGFMLAPHSKPLKVVRKVLPRKPMRKRVKYDEIDFSALQRMDKLRVDWEQHEDNILLVCKVAMVYLCPNPRRNLVSFTAIRDILRSYSFTSYNKTSRACQRRLLYMLKQPKTVNSVLLGVEEVKQDYFVNKRFGAEVDSTRGDDESPLDYENRVEKTFKDLVAYIAKKYYNILNMEQREPVTLPKTIQEFNIFYKLKLPTKIITSPGISKEVREVNDIHTATINSVIHSSMCCGKERRSWAYQLFKVYQQYPEYLLRSAMLKIRADQMVTMKKNYMCAHKKFGNCMPMSSSQYQLSSAYYYKFQTKWPYEVFSESYGILLSLLENYAQREQASIDGIEVKPGLGGIVAAIHDFITTNNLDVDIEIPDQIIMLDPGLPEKDEVYQRIALRYQAILEALSSDYTEQIKSSINNSFQSENVAPQDNLSIIENTVADNEQQSFVEIRSAKRPIEHDFILPEAKKLKLDNREIDDIDHKNSEAHESEVVNNIEVVQTVVNSDPFKESRSLEDYELDRSLDICGSTEINQSLNDRDNIHFNNVPILSKVENANTSIQSLSDKPINDDCLAEKNLNIFTRNDINIPSTSSKSLNVICVNKENEHSIENINMDSESALTGLLSNNCSENKTDIASSINNYISREPLNNDKTEKSSTRSIISCNMSNLMGNKNSASSNIEKITSTRVSELVKRVISGDTYKDVETRTDIHDVRTRQTRIAMLKMREELHDLTFHDSHHAHEYFVVNSFKLIYSLKALGEDRASLAAYRGMELPTKLLPIDVQVANKVLEDVKRHAIFPKNSISYDDFKKEVIEEGRFDWDHVHEICKFIKTRAEFGATLHELVTVFSYLGDKLANILSLLSDKRIVLRAGIVAVRYIYNRYVNPWIIHSYKILRLEKEAHPTVPEGSVYVLDNDDSVPSSHGEKNKVITAANLFYNMPDQSHASENFEKDLSPIKGIQTISRDLTVDSNIEKTKDDIINLESKLSDEVLNEDKKLDENNSQELKGDSDDDANGSPRKRLRRNRTVLLKQKDIYRAAKLLDFNTAEEIKVVIKPWIRIDGVVNRRVLDRMLGAVLCYCIEKPGISLTIVQNRFTPAIQPYHTRELIEILVKLGCVKTSVQKITKVTLFSRPAKLDLTGNPDLVADSDSVIIEPTVQATLRFGMFLSNRSYNLDFLSSL